MRRRPAKCSAGETLGILGALLSVPFAVVIQVLLDEIYASHAGEPDPDLVAVIPPATTYERAVMETSPPPG